MPLESKDSLAFPSTTGESNAQRPLWEALPRFWGDVRSRIGMWGDTTLIPFALLSWRMRARMGKGGLERQPARRQGDAATGQVDRFRRDSRRVFRFFLLQILVQPFEEYPVPEDPILRAENPMTFVGEIQETAWNAP